MKWGSRLAVGVFVAALFQTAFAQKLVPQEIDSRQVRLNLPSQPLEDALNEFAHQAGLKVMFYSHLATRVTSPRIVGVRTPSVALAELLAHTGLRFEYLDSETVAILPINDSSTRASPPAIERLATAEPEISSGNAGQSNDSVTPGGQADEGDRAPGSDDGRSANKRRQVSELGEIIVTAQKRPQNLMDVPASLTALSANELQTQGVTAFADYMTLVPSLSDFSGGSQGHGAVILRGLNTGYYQTSNTVGYYVDDIPFSATSPFSWGALLTPDPDLTDIDHLEVLKGPQATLYGATTLGGLIKTVTKKPDLNNYTGEVQLDGSSVDRGGSGYGLMGIANLPLIPGELALRLSGFDREFPGYMTNTTLGTRDRGVTRKEGGRAALRWTPIEGLDVQLNAFLQSLKVSGWNYEYVDLQSLAPLTGPYTYSAAIEPSFRTTYELYNLTIHYTVGSLGTLTNSTSYASYRDREVEDYSPWYGFFNAYAPAPVPANAAQPLIFGPTLNKFTEELRFASQRVGPIEWLGGLFFTREQVNYLYQNINVIPPTLTPIPGPAALIEGYSGPGTYKEEAIFTDLTYHFTDAIDFTAGGRYSHNQQSLTPTWTGFLTPYGVLPGRTSDTNFTYLASLSYKLAPTLNTYARVATSYRPGGPETVPQPGFRAFKPDSLTNYELGIKGDWPQQNLRAALAVYYMDWKDLQLYAVDPVAQLTVVINGGRATSKGVEFDGNYAPVQGLDVGLALAYTEAVIDSLSAGVTQAIGAVPGDSLPYTPKWSGSATADYVHPLIGKLSANFGATFRYQGSKWSDYPQDPYNTGVIVPAYRTLDLRAGIKWDRYSTQLRLSNVFNEQGLDTVVQQRIAAGNPPALASIIQPRTVTFSFNASF